MFYDQLKFRRSVRKFKDQKVEKEKIDVILKSALRAPSSRSIRPWQFIAVTDRELLLELALCRDPGSIQILQQAIQAAGFEKKDLKTTSLNIRTHYESYRDKNNYYKSKFDGYRCEQGLKLEFDFNTNLMSNVLWHGYVVDSQ